jgi:hypothetical protein
LIQRPNKRAQRTKNCYYFLNVKKIEDPPFQITAELEFKFKFLMENFLKMYKAKLVLSLPVTFNIKDLNIILDVIVSECWFLNSKK